VQAGSGFSGLRGARLSSILVNQASTRSRIALPCNVWSLRYARMIAPSRIAMPRAIGD
jgi:hypothetical protein